MSPLHTPLHHSVRTDGHRNTRRQRYTRYESRKGREKITSYSNHNKQQDNNNDRLSMSADESSTITTDATQVRPTRENIHTYEKVSGSQLHEEKTIVIKLGSVRQKNITKELQKSTSQ